MSKRNGELDTAFRGAALRPTAQRYAVLEFLARRPIHATADEIYRAVNRSDPRASRATVYNSLRSLARAGLVREVISEGKAARFDASLHPHHHFICEQCGEVEDIAWFDLPFLPGGSLLGHRAVRNFEIVFRGTCERCQRAGGKSGERP
jgi:Fe2+ or Zn2+ uptake regulation protein